MFTGAHFLQSVVTKFDEMYSAGQSVENKSLDNVVLIISHLYNFKVINYTWINIKCYRLNDFNK